MRNPILNSLYASLDSLDGVGKKNQGIFVKLVGGSHVFDLLFHVPDEWINRTNIVSVANAIPGEVATMYTTVTRHTAPSRKGLPYRLVTRDDSGQITLVYFNFNRYSLEKEFPIGTEVIVSGKVDEYQNSLQMVHPDHVMTKSKSENFPWVEPKYRLTAGLHNWKVHKTVKIALSTIPDNFPEWISNKLVLEKSWPSFKEALTNLHVPDQYDLKQFQLARMRLAYDEVLARAVISARSRKKRREAKRSSIPASPDKIQSLLDTLPFKPTNAQSKAFQEISNDMNQGIPMRRLLQGDVGSGKTLVGAMASVQCVANGLQVAFMAPTEVLARQQYDTLGKLLSPLGYNVGVLTGRDQGKTREGTLVGLAEGSIQVIVGTHALFQTKVVFRNLGLIIIDELQRFGAENRNSLAKKADEPHILIMSATPIPRTLEMAEYGDADSSIIDEKPIGRLPIVTRALPDSRMERIVTAINRAVSKGNRVYWICPRVEDDTSGAVARQKDLEKILCMPIGLVHGRMKAIEKDESLEKFRLGEVKILVATTVVEVGVDVPEATIMIIEGAENFGLAQLHQLRGRVGRGSAESYCLLMYSDPLTEIARKRLDTLRRTEDGFKLAEADLQLRGPGDTLGVKQSGMVGYKLVELPKHKPLFRLARDEARTIVSQWSEEETPEQENIKMLLSLLSPTRQK